MAHITIKKWLATTATAALALLAVPSTAGAATETLSVNLAAPAGAMTGVGEGFLYGLSQDGSAPGDTYLQPLNPTLMRGGGARVAGDGWIGDGYRSGSGYQARIASVVAQAKRVTRAPYHSEYVLMLSDLWGADLTQPGNAVYPCANGDCSNWITFIDDTVAAMKSAGITVTYEPYNEPNGGGFFPPGIGTQYWQMWNSGVKEIRRLAPGARIDGPAYAGGPTTDFQTWIQTAKAAGTLPDVISYHLEGGGTEDPVAAVAQVNGYLAADGISGITQSANEYIPEGVQNSAYTAWSLDRFAQSGMATAARGEWTNCCASGDLGVILTHTGGALVPSGQYWTYRAYADLTGTRVSTTGSGNTAVTAAIDSGKKQVAALIGDSGGFVGQATVSVGGFGSVPWLTSGGATHVEVDRIPDVASLNSPQTVFSGNVTVANGSVTVPITMGDRNGAYVMFLTPPGSSAADVTTDDAVTSGTDHFGYSAGWGTASGVADLHNGTAHWSSTAGGTATYTFTGGDVTIWGVKDHDQGIAGFSVDGGPVTYADDYATTRAAQAPLWSSSGLGAGTHTVTVSVTGTKNSASSNDIIALDDATVSPNVATIDDATTSGTNHFAYNGTWGAASGFGDLSGGTVHWSNTIGSTTTLAFTGTGATVYGVKDVDQGIATYSVDGGTARSVDHYSATRTPGASLFAVSGLSSGNHTITITVTGSKNAASTNDIIALDSATAF
ncbi:hypothetical protein Caci_3593 [Catenulispora acidiphila DSM 44928]|uniref:Uncharacterized protein n=1 Tax=Catenulispora acidiphila (strain DSM 44928 / JCM 14897 / NBRC 102108 / NRRL B-24433 / ID139908) TaxID=479433 RepID=C7QAJ9_CATAD|nr:hypothetical protein [Catenulispora acidiphila]ACU72498.1 hypothetical protein Caci_3593 [Catenulispora acidiphila DSM 44928]